MTKPVHMLTAAEIQRAYDKANDPLSLKHNTAYDIFNAIVEEIDARKRYHGGMHRIKRRDG